MAKFISIFNNVLFLLAPIYIQNLFLLNNRDLKVILQKRTKAFIIDYLIIILIGFILFMITSDLFISMMILYPITINKDFLNGKSIGKRLFGIQVQNLAGQKADEWKSALQDFLPLIPVDLAFTLIRPIQRIGDKIAGTKIGLETEQNLKTIGLELRNYKVNIKLILGLIYGIVDIYGLVWF